MSGWMKSLRQRPTVLQEPLLQRPDLATLACVTAACQLLRHPRSSPPRCQAHETEMAGDLGAPTAVTADSTWVVRRVVGKRLQEPSKALGHAAKRRLRPGHLPAICAEVYVGSASAILEACGRR